MRESIKVTLVLTFIVAAIIAAIAWMDDRPSQLTWIGRFSLSCLAVATLGLFFKMHFRADVAPDYLRTITGGYFNRDGFCFCFATTVDDGICFIEAYYQNQFDQPCHGQIALRPARGFWMTRSRIETIVFDVACEAAAFGIVRIPVPLPRELLGKKQSFEVGASVEYSSVKRRQLRFRDGICLRANSAFKNQFHTALQVAGALSGTIVLAVPAKTTLLLPSNAGESVPANIGPELKTFWRLGDPPLKLTTASVGRFRG